MNEKRGQDIHDVGVTLGQPGSLGRTGKYHVKRNKREIMFVGMSSTVEKPEAELPCCIAAGGSPGGGKGKSVGFILVWL